MATTKLPRLKALRVARFLSQQELAERAGVRRLTIVRLEGGAEARLSTARKLAEALGVQPSELLGEEEEEKNKRPELARPLVPEPPAAESREA